MYGEMYWMTEGKTRMEDFMRNAGLQEEKISEIISEMSDVVDEVRSEAKQAGIAAAMSHTMNW